MIEIDHVLIAASDLDEAQLRFERNYGLSSITGGRHPGWGTANRIIPLGNCYLELISVVDETEAARSPFGSWMSSAPQGEAIGWAVRTDNLEEIAARLRLTINAGSRKTPAGDVLRWRSAGVWEAAAEPSLPFFIQWADGSQHPGQNQVRHRAGNLRLSRLELRGSPQRLADWLGVADLPIIIVPGPARVSRIALSSPRGEFYLP
jgi:hypothetical protein